MPATKGCNCRNCSSICCLIIFCLFIILTFLRFYVEIYLQALSYVFLDCAVVVFTLISIAPTIASLRLIVKHTVANGIQAHSTFTQTAFKKSKYLLIVCNLNIFAVAIRSKQKRLNKKTICHQCPFKRCQHKKIINYSGLRYAFLSR